MSYYLLLVALGGRGRDSNPFDITELFQPCLNLPMGLPNPLASADLSPVSTTRFASVGSLYVQSSAAAIKFMVRFLMLS
jgi:hypothetical protein